MKAQAAYEELIRQARERAMLASCAALLAWDEETYMPPGGAAHRADAAPPTSPAWSTHRATDPRLGEPPRRSRGFPPGRDPYIRRRRQRPRMAAAVRPSDAAAAAAGRGDGPRHVAGPERMGRRPPARRLRPLPAAG